MNKSEGMEILGIIMASCFLMWVPFCVFGYIKVGRLGCFGQMNGNFRSCVLAEVVNYLVSFVVVVSRKAEGNCDGLLLL